MVRAAAGSSVEIAICCQSMLSAIFAIISVRNGIYGEEYQRVVKRFIAENT